MASILRNLFLRKPKGVDIEAGSEAIPMTNILKKGPKDPFEIKVDPAWPDQPEDPYEIKVDPAWPSPPDLQDSPEPKVDYAPEVSKVDSAPEVSKVDPCSRVSKVDSAPKRK